MVHRGHQHMLVLGKAEKPCPQRDFGCEMETAVAHLCQRLTQPAVRPAAGIDNIPTKVGPLDRDDQLLGYPLDGREHRAQALVAARHIGQCCTQRLGIEPAAQPHRDRHDIDR